MSVAGQQNPDQGSQSQSDTETDAERVKRMLFELMFGLVNQIFHRAATLFHGAFRRVDPLFDCISDSFFHAPNPRSNLGGGGADICYFVTYFVFHCWSSIGLSIRKVFLRNVNANRKPVDTSMVMRVEGDEEIVNLRAS